MTNILQKIASKLHATIERVVFNRHPFVAGDKCFVAGDKYFPSLTSYIYIYDGKYWHRIDTSFVPTDKLPCKTTTQENN